MSIPDSTGLNADQLDPQEPAGPRVSVVFVTFNQADALRRALTAVHASAGLDRIEILVVDCGSQDDCRTMDVDFPEIKLLRLPHHLGLTRAMNIAARTAKADLLLYLSPDAEVEPTTIPSLVERYEQAVKSDEDVVAACPMLLDEQGNRAAQFHNLPGPGAMNQVVSGGDLPTAEVDPAADQVEVDYPAIDALLIQKLFLRSMHFFDERFGHYWADADLAMQARKAEKKILLFPAVRARLHPCSDPVAEDPIGRTDRISGAAEYVAKYGSGAGFRYGGALKAFLSFDFSRGSALLGGGKLDGSQA